jgi:hypothetical protein
MTSTVRRISFVATEAWRLGRWHLRRHGQQRSEDTRRLAGCSQALDTCQSGFRQRTLPKLTSFRSAAGQRLGPTARGGAVRGTGGCWSNGLVVVLLVVGTALGVPGSWFGIAGSWSRMRHQTAAAEWSSGSGRAAAADRRQEGGVEPGPG